MMMTREAPATNRPPPETPAQRLVRWAFWCAVAAVLVLTLVPGHYLPQKGPFNFWDKAQHAPAFGGLTALGAGSTSADVLQALKPVKASPGWALLGIFTPGGEVAVLRTAVNTPASTVRNHRVTRYTHIPNHSCRAVCQRNRL